MADSIIASLPGRVHDIVRKAVNQADIHWRRADGSVLIFTRGAPICLTGGRWSWIQKNGTIIGLDRKRDGRFFLAGHGRD